MFNRATKVSAFTLLICCTSATALAQDSSWRAPTQANDHAFRPVPAMRPVPKATSSAAAPVVHQPQRDGWNLPWRESSQVKPVPKSNIDAFAAPAIKPEQHRDNRGAEQTVAFSSQQGNAIAQAAWMQKQADGLDDFYKDPFGDAAKPQGADAGSETLELPPPANATGPANALRGSSQADESGSGGLPAPAESKMELPEPSGQRPSVQPPVQAAPSLPLTPAIPTPAPQQEPPAEESFGDMLRNEKPFDAQATPDLQDLPTPGVGTEEPPADSDLFQGSFDRTADEEDVRRLNERMKQGREDSDVSMDRSFESQVDANPTVTCESFRSRLAMETIRDISLDISAPYRPDVLNEDEFQKVKSSFDEKQPSREWRSMDGMVLATGRLRDLAYEKAIIETDFGTTEEVQIDLLSENDLGFISENWGLPTECRLPQGTFAQRSWNRAAVTWKASELCHKPLYFEDVNLERYGHTHGPLVEPIVSSAHFFANIAVLPYKMGVHAPDECQYALGYYRPGNCAPWIKPAIPISVKGALYQAAAMAGAIVFVP